MMRKVLYICVAAAAVVMAGCKTECTDCVFESVVPATAQRAFLLYLATDNSLSGMGTVNLNALSSGATAESLGSGVMFVLQDIPKTNTKLVAIYIDPTSGKKQQKTVKTYSTNLDTSLPSTFKTVWSDIHKITTATEWIVSVGSHGNGWLMSSSERTADMRGRKAFDGGFVSPVIGGIPGTRALMEDNDKVMGAEAFAEMMPKVDMIILDACDMSCIEFAYALRDKAKYLILSPAEVIDNGFPYDRIVDDLFNPSLLDGAKGVCDEFYNFYATYERANARYATVSLFDTSKFADYAAAVKTALSGKKAAIEALTEGQLSTILTYDRSQFAIADATLPWGYHFPNDTALGVMYDMKGFLNQIDAWDGVQAAQEALILLHKSTGNILSGGSYYYDGSSTNKRTFTMPNITIPDARCSGVSTYIPVKAETFTGDVRLVRSSLNQEWLTTQWAAAVWK